MAADGERPNEQPTLWLGMVGFAPDDRAHLESLLNQPEASWPAWRVGPLGEADAWWVNGRHVRVLEDGNLRVAAGLPTERALNLNLSEVDRPIAFSLPLGAPDLEPRCTFDPASEASVRETLHQFEGWLRHLRAQFVLGAQVLERGESLRNNVYHVTHKGSLLAVLDFPEGKVAISPQAVPADLWQAHWDKRPRSASYLPESFFQCNPSQLAWVYVRRTSRDMLPEQYRGKKIYFRHAPRVPVRWLNDAQLMLLRELSVEPADMAALSQRTGISQGRMQRELACLYYAGALTTTRAKAAALPKAIGSGRPDSQEHLTSGPEIDALEGEQAAQWQERLVSGDLTAPATLEHRRKSQLP